MEYRYDHEDRKIHTRYSELLRCTPGQIDRVVYERTHPEERASTGHMQFGTIRHQMFEEEARKLGAIPPCFGIPASADYIEHEFATEALKDVVVHSRVDAVCAAMQTIFDYKTVVDGKGGWHKTVRSYSHGTKRRQLTFYAFQLGLHGIRITHGAFLCEVWNEARDQIVGYEVVDFSIGLRDIAAVLPWIKDRVSLLSVVLEEGITV